MDRGLCEVGAVRLRLVGRGERRGIVGCALRNLGGGDLDGLPAERSERPPAAGVAHPNGVTAFDHVVVLSPDLDRTVAALRAAGLDYRRLREALTPGGSTRQAFFRVGEPALEVVEAPEGSRIRSDPEGPARLWGVAFVCLDLDATVRSLGERAGEPRPAVQPGRRIATLRREARVGPAVAFMSPR